MAKKASVDKGNETSLDVVAQVHDLYGKEVLTNGQDFFDKYISTGIFELDLALGGGLKDDNICILSGASGSGKTALAKKLVCSFQTKYGLLNIYWDDVESQFDTAFAEEMGIDLNERFHLQQGVISAEDNTDTILNYVESTDFGMSVLDSIAAMKSTIQLEKSASDLTVGGISRAIKLLMNGLVGLIGKKRSMGLPCFNVMINRKAVGIGMFAKSGFIGGNDSQQFSSSTILEIHRTGFNEAEIWGNKVMLDTTHEIRIKKARQRSATKCTFTLSQSVHSGFPVGVSTSEVDTIVANLKFLTLWDSYAKTYVLTGEKFKTVKEFSDWLWSNDEERSFLRKLCLYSTRLKVHNRPGIPVDNYLDGEFLSDEVIERLHRVYNDHVKNAVIEISKKAVGRC